MRCFPASLAGLALCLSFTSGWSANYIVRPDGSGDFATIQDAIDVAEDGDSILLTDGTFSGTGNTNVSFAGKAVTVRSLNGNPKTCIIDCEGVTRGFLFTYSEEHDSQLKWITIRNGSYPGGAGVYVSSASPTIHGVVFEYNNAQAGGAIYT
jgi:hypothetical protein